MAVVYMDYLQQTKYSRRFTRVYYPTNKPFAKDIGHRKLALVCGFGAGKTYALVDKAIILASMDIGCISAIFGPTSPMVEDILIRTLNRLLGQWQVPFTFRASPLPRYQLQFKEHTHYFVTYNFAYQRLRGQNLSAVGFDRLALLINRT